VKSRNWVRFFISTLMIGMISTSIVGFALRWNEYKEFFITFDIKEIVSILLWLIGVGMIFSVISQMGYFAYLTVHRFGLGLFKKLWNPVQVLLIAFVFFDLVYFRYQAFGKETGEAIFLYILIPLLILLFSLIIGYFKSKSTKKQAFIPAVFFMFVVTTIEWVPALRANEESWLYLMLLPLLVCNAYQLLILPKFTESK